MHSPSPTQNYNVRSVPSASQLSQARFALEQPSTFRSVRDYGAPFGDFLELTIGGIKGQGLKDLAAFEWTLAAAFDGPDSRPLLVTDLAGIAPDQWPDLRFIFAPTLHRLATTSNAVHWWRADDTALPSRWRSLRVTQWAISRQDLAVYFRSLDADEAVALDLAREGARFSALCEALRKRPRARTEGATALKAAQYLQQWLRDGWIVRAATE